MSISHFSKLLNCLSSAIYLKFLLRGSPPSGIEKYRPQPVKWVQAHNPIELTLDLEIEDSKHFKPESLARVMSLTPIVKSMNDIEAKREEEKFDASQ